MYRWVLVGIRKSLKAFGLCVLTSLERANCFDVILINKRKKKHGSVILLALALQHHLSFVATCLADTCHCFQFNTFCRYVAPCLTLNILSLPFEKSLFQEIYTPPSFDLCGQFVFEAQVPWFVGKVVSIARW